MSTTTLMIIPVVVTVSSPALGVIVMILPHNMRVIIIAVMPSIMSVGSTIASPRHDLVISKSTLDTKLLSLAGISVLHSGIGVAHLIVLAVHEGGVGVTLHSGGDLIDSRWHVGGLIGSSSR
jgi:hypothetical protein